MPISYALSLPVHVELVSRWSLCVLEYPLEIHSCIIPSLFLWLLLAAHYTTSICIIAILCSICAVPLSSNALVLRLNRDRYNEIQRETERERETEQ